MYTYTYIHHCKVTRKDGWVAATHTKQHTRIYMYTYVHIYIYIYTHIYIYIYIYTYTNLLRSNTKRWMSCCNSYEAAHKICATHKPTKWKRLSPKFCCSSYCIFLIKFKRQIYQKTPILNPYFLPSKQCFRQRILWAKHNPRKGKQFRPRLCCSSYCIVVVQKTYESKETNMKSLFLSGKLLS